MSLEVLADLGRVDVDVDDLGGRVEVAETAHGAVVEAHADADYDVSAVGGHVGVEVSVHAEEAVGELVLFGHAGDAEQRG